MVRWNVWQVLAVLVSMLMCLTVAAVCPGQTAGVTDDSPALAASVLTDARTVDLRGEWTWPGGIITTGPVVSWNKEQPNHLWGGGVFGLLCVTPEGKLPLANLFPWVGSWLGLPETVDVDVRLGGQIEVVNIAHGPNVAGGPMVEIGLGPLLFDLRAQIAEGGQIEDLMSSKPAFFFGLRPLRF